MLGGKPYVILGPVIPNSIWFSFSECIRQKIGMRWSRGHSNVGLKMRRSLNEMALTGNWFSFWNSIKIEVLDD